MGRQQLRAVSYVDFGDGRIVPFDSLDPETKSECVKKILDNVSKTVSEYISNHPEELESVMINSTCVD